MSLVQKIDAVLPQTQCQACGYRACRPYAQALAAGQAQIDQCAPGGVETLQAVAKLVKMDAQPYLAEVQKKYRPPATVKIVASECIGCTKCIQVCPVDAIVGAAKHMHYVLPSDCTGCGLCEEACPVDCIQSVPLADVHYDKNKARQAYEDRLKRLDQEAQLQQKTQVQIQNLDKLTYIEQALLRVKQKNEHQS